MLPIPAPLRPSFDEAKRVSYGGNDLTFLASGADTAGAYALVEFITAPNPGRVPPPHRHPNLDEGFYVIEGALTMLLGDRTVTVAAPGGPDQKRLAALSEKYEIQQLS